METTVKIIKETKIVNNVARVMKTDKRGMDRMRHEQKYFMSQGRTEFNRQLSKWQDFFDETHDDFFEMESRLEKLETFVEILSGTVEDIELRQDSPHHQERAPRRPS